MGNLDAHMEALALLSGMPKEAVQRVIKEWTLALPSVRLADLNPFTPDNWAWQELVINNVAKGKNITNYEFKRGTAKEGVSILMISLLLS